MCPFTALLIPLLPQPPPLPFPGRRKALHSWHGCRCISHRHFVSGLSLGTGASSMWPVSWAGASSMCDAELAACRLSPLRLALMQLTIWGGHPIPPAACSPCYGVDQRVQVRACSCCSNCNRSGAARPLHILCRVRRSTSLLLSEVQQLSALHRPRLLRLLSSRLQIAR